MQNYNITEDIRKYVEILVDNAIENRKGYKKAKGTLNIVSKQIIALENRNNGITVRTEKIQLLTKFYSELYEAHEELKEDNIQHNEEDTPEVLTEEVESKVRKMVRQLVLMV